MHGISDLPSYMATCGWLLSQRPSPAFLIPRFRYFFVGPRLKSGIQVWPKLSKILKYLTKLTANQIKYRIKDCSCKAG